MKGQNENWEDVEHEGMPINRHRRRQLENSRGVILHLFSGGEWQSKKWKSLEKNGYTVLTLDVSCGAQQNIHHPKLWCYLCYLARRGLIRVLLGGPPCRTFSRLRHNPPVPRPFRGRDDARWCLEGLHEEELQKVHGDLALVLKMFGLYEMMVESPSTEQDFLLEHPADPEDYVQDSKLRDFAQRN